MLHDIKSRHDYIWLRVHHIKIITSSLVIVWCNNNFRDIEFLFEYMISELWENYNFPKLKYSNNMETISSYIVKWKALVLQWRTLLLLTLITILNLVFRLNMPKLWETFFQSKIHPFRTYKLSNNFVEIKKYLWYTL